MPTKKIRDLKSPPDGWERKQPCLHPDHNPPSHMAFTPGLWEHECPACGKVQEFTVRGVYR